MNRTRDGRRCLAAAALLFLWVAPADAQTLTAGAVSGGVRDARGAALNDVLITVTDVQGAMTRSVSTDRAGAFRIGEIAPGEYSVRAERIGFVPVEFVQVPVLPNRVVALSIVLQATTDPAPSLRSDRFMAGALGAGEPGRALWVPTPLLRALPFMRDELDEIARLSSRADAAGGFEGLPARLTSFTLDGFSFRGASLPVVSDVPSAGTGFPLGALDAASVMAPQMDVEWGGAAGGDLAGYSRRPGPDMSGALDASGSSGLDGTSYTHLKGALSAGGSGFDDSARFGITVAGRQGNIPLSAEWRPSVMSAELLALARDRAGLDLGAQLRRGTVSDNTITAAARLTWRISGKHSLESTVAAGLLPDAVIASAGALGPRLESGHDALAGVTLRSILGGSLTNSLRLSFARSSRASASDAGSRIFIVAEELGFGATGPVEATESAFQVSEALEAQSGRNTLKAGAEVLWSMFDHVNRADAAPRYTYGSVADLDDGLGYFERTVGGADAVEWSVPRIALFAQNRWTSPIGADVIVGFRAEQVSLRTGQVPVDQEFLTLTGIASNRTPESSWQVSPRISARWDLRNEHEWVMHATAAVFQDRLDPALASAWLTDNGTAVVHELVGNVGTFSDTDPAAARSARRVSLLDGDVRGPQSARVSTGVSRAIGTRGSIEISGVYRDTRYLPRRADINLIPSAVATDIFGRPVYGQLSQQGELVVPVPGTNRRFSSYDEVAAFRSDGRARYWGITVGSQMTPATPVSVMARYTFSRATDDWFGGRSGGWMTPGPGLLPGIEDWSDGRSDFDAPHRAVLALEVDAPMGVSLAGVYRFESGRPFTPGFQTGVDINGDGYAGNDPAFVDSSIPGTTDIVAEWSCLKPGAFSERNSCRAAATHTIDARAKIAITRGAGFGAAIVVDALNVLDTRIDVPEAALYVVDPSGTLVQAGGSVSVPLMANPRFGEPRAGAASRRMFRLGISLNW